MNMKRNKALLLMCCAVLTVSGISAGSVSVHGARITKPSASQDREKSVAASVFGSATQALDLIDLAQEERIERIGEMCRLDYAKSGVLASVTAAQCILESGYLTSELASKANNCFGMKAMLSNNDWENSAWDGSSVYSKETREEYGGQVVTITADFRQYDSVEESLADHSAYLLGAKSGSGLRYEGLKGEEDYKQAVQIIKNGGYATDSSYVDKVCAIIERHDLTRFDDVEAVDEEEEDMQQAEAGYKFSAKASSAAKKSSETKKSSGSKSGEGLSYRDGYYRVRKSWTDIDGQLGAFSVLENAKSVCKPGYNVYDAKGNVVYTMP